ncbi:hypothetical protein [Knoellia koreensis]|uniref:Uncharacterized protein n=1 Tax=Knoellia koreensis TaxID=2730921 RepID=A0A849HE88_9MICO|nr:hypothetical protein [Knoellia sp. DB2414S]NNM44521.1 hypothetical protein [Knoellia sp. DB2414S]
MSTTPATTRSARHTARRSPLAVLRPTTRRARLVTGALSFLLVASMGAALAAFFGHANIRGNGSTGKFVGMWTTQGLALNSTATTTTTKTAPTVTSGVLSLPSGLEFFPGESYAWDGSVSATGTRPGYVSGLSLPGLPEGYTATLTKGCKTFMEAGRIAYVGVKITRDDGTDADGVAWTLAEGASVLLSPLPASATATPTSATCQDTYKGTSAAA